MSDHYWEPLAEIYIAGQDESLDPNDYIYCLCSRVFIRNPEVYTVLASEDASEEEDNDGDCMGEMLDLHKGSGIEIQSIEKHDEEPVSCYCSASHTDNNYSTDEHDSVRDSIYRSNTHSLNQKLGLHQSDSGADLSEYHHDQHEAKSIQNLLATYGKTFQTTEIEVENDCKHVDIPPEYNQTEESDPDCLIAVNLPDKSFIKDDEILNYNLYSKKDKHYTDDSTSFILGDRESMAQSLSGSTTVLNKESLDKDLTSCTQNDCESYTYPYSTYYGNTKSEMDIAWEKFWAINGEQIIWTSWIEKYADYINPDYFQDTACATEDEKLQTAEINEVVIEKYSEQNTCFPNQAHRNCELLRSNFAGIFNKSNSSDGDLKPSSNTSFSFEQTNKQEVNDKDADDNRRKIINFEVSPEAGDGWNPLSPFSIEESYNQHSNAEDERLLTRCDSINGSIAKTNATSDSMTNVTKMTLTSSSCDSNSVHSSSLISSVTSSIESNITSSSSDQENEFISEDNDKYWQHLWKENFQIQYQKQYELFIENYKKEHRVDCVPTYSEIIECVNEIAPVKNTESDQSDEQDSIPNDTSVSNKINSSKNKNISRKIWPLKSEENRTKKLIIESVGMLLRNLSMKSEDYEPTDAADEKDNNTTSTDEHIHVQNRKNTQNTAAVVSRNNTTQGVWQTCNGGDGDEPHEKKSTLKRSHEADFDESGEGLETVKKAFLLLGYAFNENLKTKLQGEVIYRKRNIKLQNRLLKMRNNRKYTCARANNHIYFDENGVQINNYKDKHPSDISEAQCNDKRSYVTTYFTSSSDEEEYCDESSLFRKLKQFKSSSNKTNSINLIDQTALLKSQSDIQQGPSNNLDDEQNNVQCKEIVQEDNNIQCKDTNSHDHSEYDETGQEDVDSNSENRFVVRNRETLMRKMEIEGYNFETYLKFDKEDNKKIQKKTRRKQLRRTNSLPLAIANDKSLMKYWFRRYELFSKFDQGIKLDHESWFSVTPENIAEHTARRCRSNIIVDGFCGAGGNSIQFAFTCKKVIAIDVDPKKIELARNNARVYNVEDRIEFIVGDFLKLAPTLVADVVFLSPPWGGPNYIKQKVFDLNSILPGVGGVALYEAAKKITKNVAYYLPRNVDVTQVFSLVKIRSGLELEKNCLQNKKFVAITAYFGDLIEHKHL